MSWKKGHEIETHLPLRPQMATFSPPWIAKFKFFKARFWASLPEESSSFSDPGVRVDAVADASSGALCGSSTSQLTI